ncbi:MAG: Gfo/Idh/MocA family protein [Gemmataceae bacterium]
MNPSRRAFLKTSSAVTLSALTYNRVLGANEKLNIGLIGSGGRGRALISEAVKQGQNCAALCDVAEFRLNDTVAALQKLGQKTKPEFFGDHRKLLGEKGIDAVIIATPDHWHHDCLLDAMAASKDTYVEKPLSKNIEEGKSMVAAVRQTKCVVQVGNQRHSGEHWKRCRDVIQSKAFGDLVWVKVWDCRNWVKSDPFAPPVNFKDADKIDWKRFLGKAPDRPFDAHRYFAWRWFWDYAGGLMTDIGAHQLDIVQWLGGQDKGPKSVVANGGNYHFKYWETPDVVHGIWDYGTFAATFAVEFVNGYDGVGATFYGTKQTLWADADKEVRVYDTIDKPKSDQKPIASWPVVYEGPAHMKNWLECCKSRQEPNSTIELGHRVITAAHLANLSYRTGRKILWDAEKQQEIAAG